MDGFLTDVLFNTTRARARGRRSPVCRHSLRVETFLFSLTP